MRRVLKKGCYVIGAVLAFLIIVVLAYIAYLFISYDRIEDNQNIEIRNEGSVRSEAVSIGTEYSIVSYNIGFGAYSSDYSFFMDGGKYSRALSKESVLENTQGSIDILSKLSPDFIFLQEVDLKATRSYHINQYEMILEQITPSSSAFAVNFDSAYLFYPLIKPHGKSLSGIATISKYAIESTLRRSLPISTSIYKFFDLDRGYEISRIPVDNGKYLSLYNVHLSAYTEDKSIVENQIAMLVKDFEQDYLAGNYIVCGGDFNQDLLGNSPEIFGTSFSTENWASPFPVELLPEGIDIAVRMLSENSIKELAPTCRNADSAYKPGESFVTMVDGFLISDNVEMIEYTTLDEGFAYSDHNPVMMRFLLK